MSQTIWDAVFQNDLESLKTFSDLNLDTLRDRNGDSLLHLAVDRCTDLGILWYLLRYIDPDVENNEGETPLHVILKFWPLMALEKIRILIPYGASTYKRNREGQDCYDYSRKHQRNLVDFLQLLENERHLARPTTSSNPD